MTGQQTRQKKLLKKLKIEYIYLRITPEIARLRSKNRDGNNHFDKQTKDYHQRVFKGYEHFFKKIKCFKIDASKDKTISISRSNVRMIKQRDRINTIV